MDDGNLHQKPLKHDALNENVSNVKVISIQLTEARGNEEKCQDCNIKNAVIFQDEDEFCLECWQVRTEPYITNHNDQNYTS